MIIGYAAEVVILFAEVASWFMVQCSIDEAQELSVIFTF